MRELQAQVQARAAHLQRRDQVLARDQPLGRLPGLLVALVAAPADQLARQQAGVGLQRHAARDRPSCRPGSVNAGRQQQRQRGVQHVGHRRVDPFHRRAGAGELVEGAVGELGARPAAHRRTRRRWRGSRRGSEPGVVPDAARATAAASPDARPVRAAGRTESRSRPPSRAVAPARRRSASRVSNRLQPRQRPRGRRPRGPAPARSACGGWDCWRNRSRRAAGARLRTVTPGRRWRRWPSGLRAAPATPCRRPHRGRARAFRSTSAGWNGSAWTG